MNKKTIVIVERRIIKKKKLRLKPEPLIAIWITLMTILMIIAVGIAIKTFENTAKECDKAMNRTCSMYEIEKHGGKV